ncbi:MAG TPA: hypothetical protein VM537_11495 [Anaerolineae bacterium]|nr:hypothetical protein [Anaerolineae bacterium]
MEGWGCCCIGVFGIGFLYILFGLALGLAVAAEMAVGRIRGAGTRPLLRPLVVVPSAIGLWLIAVVLVIIQLRAATGNCLEAPYQEPPGTFQDEDLVGMWQAHYGRSVDRLVIKGDGTFEQVYIDHYTAGYVFESGWNEWWVERVADGRTLVHLQGARYYPDGIRIAEEERLHDPFPARFYDPVTDEAVHVAGKLVLNVRTDSSGELFLYHLWSYADQGFAMFGCERDLFHQLEAD